MSILDHRCYDKNLASQYTRDVYNIDIASELERVPYYWDYFYNTYEMFNNKYPVKSEDDGSREYFTKVARKRYIKFYSEYIDGEGTYDQIIDFGVKASVIHHIYPLVFGGSNDLQNLIAISDYNHDILHMNPLEKDRKCCYKALDYFSYISNVNGIRYIMDKYKIEINKENLRLTSEFIGCAKKEEMFEFYDYLKSGSDLCAG